MNMNYTIARLNGLFVAVLLLLGTTQQVMGQEARQPDPTVITTGIMKAPLQGTVNAMEADDEWDAVLKTSRKQPLKPGIDVRKDEYRRLKAEANANRDQAMPTSAKTAAGPGPTQTTNFLGNFYNGSDPADNAIAVSAGGRILSATNTRIHAYDSTGNQLFGTTLNGFSISLLGLSNFKFDPVVTYDPSEDRFIIIFLSGANPNNSNLVLGFSTSNNPAGNYNLYSLSGNPFNNNLWTDFPQIALSTDELFITGNLFDTSPASNGTAIWQINKFDGYNGDSLDFVAWQADQYFSMHPVEGGSELYGPNMYFVRTITAASTTDVFLHEITNTIDNNGQLMAPNAYTLNTPYSFPTDASQGAGSDVLSTNENRVQTSYFQNGRIEFAFNSGVSGVPGLYHGTGVISPITPAFNFFSGQLISYTGYHLGYPSITYAGSVAGDGTNRSFLTFNYAGPNILPGNAGIFIDENGTSDMTILRDGDAIINAADDRWGDYTDAAERPGKPGEIWFAGTFGNAAQQQRTWISALELPQAVSVEAPQPERTLEVYPNPSVERVVFRFPVDEAASYDLVIRDLMGREIKRLVQYDLRLGEATLSFNVGHLAAGTYSVTVETTDKVLFSEKFSVQK